MKVLKQYSGRVFKYAILKDGKYLSSQFPISFEATDPVTSSTNIYWYRSRLIAGDIARQLGAEVVALITDNEGKEFPVGLQVLDQLEREYNNGVWSVLVTTPDGCRTVVLENVFSSHLI